MHSEIKDEMVKIFSRVYDSNWFIHGKECSSFEDEYAQYIGASYCVGCGNGMDALYLLLRAYKIGVGDEVIVPAHTYIATALAVSYAGATPVLVDVKKETYNLNPLLVEKAISSKTKAIIAVHLYGQPAEMDEINEIAKKNELIVIEDAAQAHGAMYKGKRTGNLADAAAFSFYPGKNLGALGDAGVVITNDSDIAKKVRILGNYGSSEKYHHEVAGVNSRLDELQASLLTEKLKHLDKWNIARKKIVSRYLLEIKNQKFTLPKISEGCESTWHLFVVQTDTRDEFYRYMQDKGIGTLIHYPIPIHLQNAYNKTPLIHSDLPVTEEIVKKIISLPLYYGMANEDVDYVINAINSY